MPKMTDDDLYIDEARFMVEAIELEHFKPEHEPPAEWIKSLLLS